MSGTGGTSNAAGSSAGRASTGGSDATSGTDSDGGRAGSPHLSHESGSSAGGQGGQSGETNGGEGGLNGGESSAGSPAGGAGGESPEEPPVIEDAGLPCAIKTLLSTRCQGCHARPPITGTTQSLLTYADLIALSSTNPSVTVAAHALQRMKDSVAPMPPAPAAQATSEEITTLQNWLNAGAPRGKCEFDPHDPNADPYDAPPNCSGGSYWTANDSGSPWMMPGNPCIACHVKIGAANRAPLFTVAGTLYPTAHEPDKCWGTPESIGAKIIITDANGQEQPPIKVVSGGNFGVIIPGLKLPYRAKVVIGDAERVMLTPQTNGDCNGCHTQSGAQGARGRVLEP